MPKRTATPQPPQNRLVVALAYDGLCTFEFGVAVEIFGLDRPEMGADWYRFRVAAIEPGPLRAAGGIRVETRRRPVASSSAPAPSSSRAGAAPTRRVPRPADRGAAARARAGRAAAVVLLGRVRAGGHRACSTAGGRRRTGATPSAWRAPIPASRVVPDVLYVDEGNLLTAAGSAAGIDLSLHLIRRDWGTAAANSVARRLVVPAASRRRPGAVHRGAGARGQGRGAARAAARAHARRAGRARRPSRRWRAPPA